MNIICIYHSRDLDGWMSAAIVKKWYGKATNDLNAKHKIVLEEGGDQLDFLGWDYGDSTPDLSDYDKVIMVDVSFPKETMWELRSNLGKDFIWIDHHSSAIKENIQMDHKKPVFEGLQNINAAACELTWMYFNHAHVTNETLDWEEMPEIVRLLGRYDCFGHKGTKEEQMVLRFQYGARQLITNYEDAYENLIKSLKGGFTENTIEYKIHQKGKVIYQYLCTEAKQTYSKSFPITFTTIVPEELISTEELYGTDPRSTLHIHKFLAVNQERFNPINFGIDYHKEGYDGFACFWYKNGKWHWSLYNDDGNVDCSTLAKQYGGGGHKGASGFVINDLKQIINN